MRFLFIHGSNAAAATTAKVSKIDMGSKSENGLEDKASTVASTAAKVSEIDTGSKNENGFEVKAFLGDSQAIFSELMKLKAKKEFAEVEILWLANLNLRSDDPNLTEQNFETWIALIAAAKNLKELVICDCEPMLGILGAFNAILAERKNLPLIRMRFSQPVLAKTVIDSKKNKYGEAILTTLDNKTNLASLQLAFCGDTVESLKNAQTLQDKFTTIDIVFPKENPIAVNFRGSRKTIMPEISWEETLQRAVVDEAQDFLLKSSPNWPFFCKWLALRAQAISVLLSRGPWYEIGNLRFSAVTKVIYNYDVTFNKLRVLFAIQKNKKEVLIKKNKHGETVSLQEHTKITVNPTQIQIFQSLQSIQFFWNSLDGIFDEIMGRKEKPQFDEIVQRESKLPIKCKTLMQIAKFIWNFVRSAPYTPADNNWMVNTLLPIFFRTIRLDFEEKFPKNIPKLFLDILKNKFHNRLHFYS